MFRFKHWGQLTLNMEKTKLKLMVKYTGDKPPNNKDIKASGTVVIGNKVIEIEGAEIIKKEKVDKLI